MLWTLQKYIVKDMVKTFFLMMVGLTSVFLLGGGVLNMIKIGDVSPSQLIRLLVLLLPLTAAMTLPVAAIYSAASTYGRLSADNELTACRSSGINIIRLFLPSVIMSIITAIITFLLFNYLIPVMFGNLNQFVSNDIGDVVRKRITQQQGLPMGGKMRIRADKSNFLEQENDGNKFIVRGVVFVESDKNQWIRFGTIDQVTFLFEEKNNTVQASANLFGFQYYDEKTDQYFTEESQSIARINLPLMIKKKLKFLNLNKLLYLRNNIHEWDKVKTEVNKLSFELTRYEIFESISRELINNNQIILSNEKNEFTIQADSMIRSGKEKVVELKDLKIKVITGSKVSIQSTIVTATRGNFNVVMSQDEETPSLILQLFDVQMNDGNREINKVELTYHNLSVSDLIIDRFKNIPVENLISESKLGSDAVKEQSDKVEVSIESTSKSINSVLHERFAFSSSICVLIILATALGIIFRGSHIMIAFGISVLPLLLVIIGIVSGKELLRQPDTGIVGISVIWSGIVITILADFVLLTKVLKR